MTAFSTDSKPKFNVIGNVKNYDVNLNQIGYTLVENEYYYYSGQPISDYFMSDFLTINNSIIKKSLQRYFPTQIPYSVNAGFPADYNDDTFFTNRFQFDFTTGSSWIPLNQIFLQLPISFMTRKMDDNNELNNAVLNLSQWPQMPWLIAQMISQIQIKINDAIIVGTETFNYQLIENPVLNSLLNSYSKEDIDVISKLGTPFQQTYSWGAFNLNGFINGMNLSMSDPKFKMTNLINIADTDYRFVPLYMFSNFFNRKTFLPPGTKICVDVELQSIFQQLRCAGTEDPLPGYYYTAAISSPAEDLSYRDHGVMMSIKQYPSICFYEHSFEKNVELSLTNEFLTKGFFFNTVELEREQFFNSVTNNSVGYELTPGVSNYQNVILNISSVAPEYILFFLTKPAIYSKNKDENSSYIKPFTSANALINVPSFTDKNSTRLLEFMPFSFKNILINANGINMVDYGASTLGNDTITLRFLIEKETKNFFLEEESVLPISFYNTKDFVGSFCPIRVTDLNPYINRNQSTVTLTGKQITLNFDIVDVTGKPFQEKLQLRAYVIKRKQYHLTGNTVTINTLPTTRSGELLSTSTWML